VGSFFFFTACFAIALFFFSHIPYGLLEVERLCPCYDDFFFHFVGVSFWGSVLPVDAWEVTRPLFFLPKFLWVLFALSSVIFPPSHDLLGLLVCFEFQTSSGWFSLLLEVFFFHSLTFFPRESASPRDQGVGAPGVFFFGKLLFESCVECRFLLERRGPGSGQNFFLVKKSRE